MKKKDDREKIGENLKAGYLSDDMEEGPSPELVAKWIAIADQRRARIRRRNKMLLSCAAVFVLCIGVTVTCIVKPSSAVAGNEGGTKIESGLETKYVYKSEADIPDDIKEEFLMFPYIPEGYEFSEATVEEVGDIKNILLSYKNKKNQDILIKENITNEGIATQNSNQHEELLNLAGVLIRVTQYEGEKFLYSFLYEDIAIIITAPQNIEGGIKEMIEKAVSK